MQNIYSVSVRALAEFALEKGDLSPVMQAAARMQDGVRGHKVLQEMLPWNWRPEFPVSSDVTLDGGVLRIHGRADAAYIGTDSISVLEIKTTTNHEIRLSGPLGTSGDLCLSVLPQPRL